MTAVVSIDGESILLQTPFHLAHVCREIVGGKWDRGLRVWRYPLTTHGVANVLTALKSNAIDFGFPDMRTKDKIAGMLGRLVAVESVQSSSPESLPDVPNTKMPPWGHQKTGYHMLCQQESTYLIWEMGCGKSAPPVWYINNRRPKLSLIVCPLPVVPVWPREFAKHATTAIQVVPLDAGTIPKRIERAKMAMREAAGDEVPCVIVVNYECLYQKEFVTWAAGIAWDFVMGDELHKVKSPSGVASKAFAMIGRKAKKRAGLTGTPMHSPMDLYGQFRFLDPGIFGTSYVQFRNEYAIMGGYLNKEVTGYRNMDRLKQKLYSIAHRVTAKEALPFLPGFRYVTKNITLCPDAQAAYKSMKRDLIVKIGNGEVTAANALAKLLRLQQITSGYLVTEEIIGDKVIEKHVRLDDGKRKCLEAFLTEEAVEFFETIGGNPEPDKEPVVVFCRFSNDLAEVKGAAEACGRRYMELSGDAKQWEEWQYNCKAGEVIGVQIQSGGAGIDLTRAKYVFDYSVGFSLIDYLQSRKRTLRPGQKRDVTYVQCVAGGTVDEQAYARLSRAADVCENILQKGELPMIADDMVKYMMGVLKEDEGDGNVQ